MTGASTRSSRSAGIPPRSRGTSARERLYVAERQLGRRERRSTRARTRSSRRSPSTPFRERTHRPRTDGGGALARWRARSTSRSAARTPSRCTTCGGRRAPRASADSFPTGWYPSSLDVSADGRIIAVGTLFGVGSGDGTRRRGKRGRYVHAVRGSVNVIAVPTDAQLDAYTTAVAQNNRLAARDVAGARRRSRASTRAPRAVPRAAGRSVADRARRLHHPREPHVRPGARRPRNGRERFSSLVMYGRDVTPNAHALVRAVRDARSLLRVGWQLGRRPQLAHAGERDRLSRCGRCTTAAAIRRRAIDALAYSSGGFLWEAREAKGKTVTVFGEYAPSPQESSEQRPRRDARRSTATQPQRLRVSSRAAAEAVRHAAPTFRRSTAARARVSGLDAGSAGRREGRRDPRASARVGDAQERCRIS